jgi:general stress protein YciG
MSFRWEYEDTPQGRRYRRVPVQESSAFDIDLVTGNQIRGFAEMDKEQLVEVSRKGGKTAHQLGRAHCFSSEEASKAGKKGLSVRLAKARQMRAELWAREAEEDPQPERYKPEYPKPEVIVSQPKEK